MRQKRDIQENSFDKLLQAREAIAQGSNILLIPFDWHSIAVRQHHSFVDVLNILVESQGYGVRLAGVKVVYGYAFARLEVWEKARVGV